MLARRIAAAANKVLGSGLPKLSSIIEPFDAQPSTTVWTWGGGTTFTGGNMTITGDHVEVVTDDNYDFTNDTISIELISGTTGEFGAVGPAGAGGYLIQKTAAGNLRCDARDAGGYFDGGAVEVPYNATNHRWLFIRHTGSQVIFEAAAAYSGARTTLRTAALTTVDHTALYFKVQNNDANATVWDNINTDGNSSPPPPTGDVSIADINFAVAVMTTDPSWLGAGSSTYGASPHNNPTQAAVEQRLDARYMRIPVRWNGTSVVSSAGGGGYNDILGLVNLYRSWGFRCLVVIAGRTNDFDGYVAGDATQIVNVLGTNMIDYSVSNEPDNVGKNEAQILAQSIQIYDDIQVAAPGTKVWGPVLASFKRTQQRDWAEDMGISRFAGIDYHHYAMGGTYETTANALAVTSSWGTEITQTKADLAALGLPQIVNCDEINFSWRYNDGTPPDGNNFRFFTAVNTVFLASAIGHNLRAGGRIMPYALQNGPLGLITEPGHAVNPDGRPPSTPMPGYWGVAAWTGEQRFSHYNNAFYSVQMTDNPVTTEVFAVNNEDGGYNIILINKSEIDARDVQVNLAGVTAGTYDAYQTVPANPYDQPVQIITASTYTDELMVDLPAMTVTTVVLQPA